MTFEDLTNSLPLITGILFGISILFVFLSALYFRRGRRAPYWTQRRTASDQGLQILMVAVFFLTISAIACGLTLVYNYIEPEEVVEDNNTVVAFTTNTALPVTVFPTESAPTDEEDTFTVTPTLEPNTPLAVSTATDEQPTLELSPTATDEPSLEPTEIPSEVPPTNTIPAPTDTAIDDDANANPNTVDTADSTAQDTVVPTATFTATDEPPTATDESTLTATPSATSTETLTHTPSFTPTETLVPSATPLPQATAIVHMSDLRPFRTPSTQADLDILVVASGVSDRQQPLNSGLNFGSDLTRLYYFVKFENMIGGSLWQAELYRSGTLIYQRQALWGNSAEGETYFFIGLPDGYAAGDYELQLTIGTQPNPITSTSFTVNK